MKPEAGGGPGGHSLRMNGGGPCTCAGGGGVCGRPTSDVDQVPTHRSPPPCATRTGLRATSRNPIPTQATILMANTPFHGFCRAGLCVEPLLRQSGFTVICPWAHLRVRVSRRQLRDVRDPERSEGDREESRRGPRLATVKDYFEGRLDAGTTARCLFVRIGAASLS